MIGTSQSIFIVLLMVLTVKVRRDFTDYEKERDVIGTSQSISIVLLMVLAVRVGRDITDYKRERWGRDFTVYIYSFVDGSCCKSW